MSDASQLPIPASFIALYVPPGRSKPTHSQADIGARHEFCEDLASALVEQAKTKVWELGVAESDVLDRIHQGLLVPASGLAPREAWWVLRRLAELLEWEPPAWALEPPPPSP